MDLDSSSLRDHLCFFTKFSSQDVCQLMQEISIDIAEKFVLPNSEHGDTPLVDKANKLWICLLNGE